jgi:hypothetical protein
VAALLVREEALAVSKTIAPPAEEPAALANILPLEARAQRSGLMTRAQLGTERYQ